MSLKKLQDLPERRTLLSKNVFVVSLGCSKNHCDLENMMGLLKSADYNIVLDEYTADIAIINTCGFIEDAKKEAIENIIRTAELKKTGKLKTLIVTGCLSQRYKDEILEQFPEVDIAVGVFDFDKIVEIIEKNERKVYADSEKLENFDSMPRLQATPFYTAYLKISEGCDNCCTYCAIPKIRGRMRHTTYEKLALFICGNRRRKDHPQKRNNAVAGNIISFKVVLGKSYVRDFPEILPRAIFKDLCVYDFSCIFYHWFSFHWAFFYKFTKNRRNVRYSLTIFGFWCIMIRTELFFRRQKLWQM